MGTEIANLDAFKGKAMAGAFAAVPLNESLADGIGSSYGVIGYRGKNWSLRYRGDEHMLMRPDDGTPVTYIDVIILRQSRVKSKTLFEAWDPANAEGKRPICASIDGVIPDADVAQKQSDTCALCKKNVWYTNDKGMKTKDCQDYKRLAVMMMPKQTGAVLGAPLMEPVFLRVPAASLSDLATFGETMEAQGWHFFSFITRISFDPTLAHPKFIFRPQQPLTDKEAAIVLPLREDPVSLRITGEERAIRPALIERVLDSPEEIGRVAGAKAEAEAVRAAEAEKLKQAVARQEEKDRKVAAKKVKEEAQARAAAANTAKPQVAPENDQNSGFEDMGFDTATIQAASPPVAAVQTVEDVGEPSDPDLDAKIQALLGS